MALNLESQWRKEALALVCTFVGIALSGSAFVLYALTDRPGPAVAYGVLLIVAIVIGALVLREVAASRLEAVSAAWETVHAVAGIERLRLRIIIHTAMRSAIALTGDPRAEDMVDIDQLDYLVEHTVDAIVATNDKIDE